MKHLQQLIPYSLFLILCLTACKHRNLDKIDSDVDGIVEVIDDGMVVAPEMDAAPVLASPAPASSVEREPSRDDKMSIAANLDIQYFESDGNGNRTARSIEGVMTDITFQNKPAKQILLSDGTTIICEEVTEDNETILLRIGGSAPDNPR